MVPTLRPPESTVTVPPPLLKLTKFCAPLGRLDDHVPLPPAQLVPALEVTWAQLVSKRSSSMLTLVGTSALSPRNRKLAISTLAAVPLRSSATLSVAAGGVPLPKSLGLGLIQRLPVSGPVGLKP